MLRSHQFRGRGEGKKSGGRARHRDPCASCWRLPKPRTRRPQPACDRKRISGSRSTYFNFYQAKRIRSTVTETAAAMLEAQKSAVTDPKAQEAFEKQIADFKATVARYERTKGGEDSMDAIQDRAKEASEDSGNWPIAGSGITNSGAA